MGKKYLRIFIAFLILTGFIAVVSSLFSGSGGVPAAPPTILPQEIELSQTNIIF